MKQTYLRTKDVVGLGLGVTVGAGVFMATGKASSEAGPASWLKWKLVHVLVVQRPLTQGIVGCTPTNVPLWEIPI